MSRRSSKDKAAEDLRVIPEAAYTRAAEFLGFVPSAGQQKVKSEFWARWRDDPRVSPDRVTPALVGQMVDAPSIDKWWREDGFRQWFLNKEGWKSQAEFLSNLFLDKVQARLMQAELMQDKDLIQMGKLLLELTGRISKVPPKEPEKLALPPDQARAKFNEMALALGYIPPKPADEQEPHAPAQETDASGSTDAAGAPGPDVPD